MSISIYTLTSDLHDEQSVDATTQAFLATLGHDYVLTDDYADYGTAPLSLIFVRTGGTEGLFKQLLPQLVACSKKPFYLLASTKSNSLPAAMEILSFLRQQGLQGEILHGSSEYIAARIQQLNRVEEEVPVLNGCRLGIVGEPSDWLISSEVDRDAVKSKLGVDLIDIPMRALLDTLASIPEQSAPEDSEVPQIHAALPGAYRIYLALKSLVVKHNLNGLTLRCFDLLDAVHNTGCWALAKLNAEGLVAGCEGDVPTCSP